MKKKDIILVFATVATVLISGIILYETVIANNYLGDQGLVGVFLASLFSHLTVVGRDLFVPTFLSLTRSYSPIILGLVAGWAGAIGEITTYYWGLGVRKVVEDEEVAKDSLKWINKYGLIAILIVAMSPLPDTPIILLSGSVRFPLTKLLVVEGVGKTLLYTFGAFLGGSLFMNLNDIAGTLGASFIIIVASTVLCVLTTWRKTRRKIFELVKKVVAIIE